VLLVVHSRGRVEDAGRSCNRRPSSSLGVACELAAPLVPSDIEAAGLRSEQESSGPWRPPLVALCPQCRSRSGERARAQTWLSTSVTGSDIRALTFDTGGTVLDWHSGIREALAEAGRRHRLERDWVTVTNDYRRRAIRRMVNKQNPGFNMDDVHREVFGEIVVEHELEAFSREDFDGIVGRWHSLETWPDFAGAQRRLRERRNALHWDVVISCEMLNVYKPRPEAYRKAAKLLQLRPGQIVMVAAHSFDLDAAAAVGYRTAFVHRPSEWGLLLIPSGRLLNRTPKSSSRASAS
jgi:2-haloacid dehalogenase